MSRWQDEAACAGMTPEESDRIFFNDTAGRPTYTEAKTYCGRCPVIESCRKAGLREEFGYWGGRPAGLAVA